MKNVRELAEVNQGDDDPDNDVLIAPQPTRREVLQATSTIHQYINTLNDPLANLSLVNWRDFYPLFDISLALKPNKVNKSQKSPAISLKSSPCGRQKYLEYITE